MFSRGATVRGFSKAASGAAAVVSLGLLTTSTASVAQPQPGSTLSTVLEIDEVAHDMLQCVGLGSATQVIESETTGPDGQLVTVKSPGPTRHYDLVCSRPMSDDQTLVEWQQEVFSDPSQARRDVDVVLYDAALGEFARFRYHDAWPSELLVVEDVTIDAVLEVVTIISNEMERVS
jgi:phage tail-like protein